MAFDGIVIANIVSDLNKTILNGRISKIAQPEADELFLTIKGDNRETYKLDISANASLPLLYLTETNKVSPSVAPSFCMLLRKHLSSAKILEIIQPDMERIIRFKFEHYDEMGDLCQKYLMVELMGKYSNIIFCDSDFKIIDSIKRINHFVSSVREVLPGRDYFIPNTENKINPLTASFEDFQNKVLAKAVPITKAIYTTFNGISPMIANEAIERASLNPDVTANLLEDNEALHLYKTFLYLLDEVKEANFHPHILYEGDVPKDFSSITLKSYSNYVKKEFDSVSTMLEQYYATKNAISRIRQKSSDLRRIVSNALDRTSKKYDLQLKQLKDTEKRDKYKVYGELITTYGYQLEEGAKELICENYYDENREIKIPLDPTISAIENAKHYFDKYSKLKRTYDALTTHIEETKDELAHLKSIQMSLDIALLESDLTQLKKELVDYGYIKKHTDKGAKKGKAPKTAKSKPLHFVSSDGYHIYVGKNNYQNDELTFDFAEGKDWWFHSKTLAGSHVIVKTGGEEIPDRTYEEAARLAAYFSSGRDAGKVEIDYTLKKNVKKPGGGKPGFVVYYTNYSMVASADITGIKEISD